MIDPKNKRDIKRLIDDIARSRRDMKPHIEHRDLVATEIRGHRYGEPANSAGKRLPHNLLETAYTTYMSQLAGGTPQFKVSVSHRELMGVAELIETDLNKRMMKAFDLPSVTRRGVGAAFIGGVAIAKVGLASKTGAGPEDIDPGEPFVEMVDLDDWIYDSSAYSLDQCLYMGNRFELDRDLAYQTYPKLKKLREQHMGATGATDDSPRGNLPEGEFAYAQDMDEEMSERRSSGIRGDDIKLMEIHLRREALVIVIDEYCNVIDEKPWEHDATTYHVLSFTEIERSAFPLAPSHAMLDGHIAFNKLFRKLVRQADKSKRYRVFEKGKGDEDNAAVEAVGDCGSVGVSEIGSTEERTAGAVDQQVMGVAMQTRQLFSAAAGNLDALAGLGPQSGTVGQDRLLAESASVRVNAMRVRVAKWLQGIARDLAYYDIWDNPLLDQPVARSVQVGGRVLQTQARLTPERMMGQWLDYNFELDPYTLADRTPATRLEAVERFVQGTLIPLLPIFEQQNLKPDLLGITRVYADLLGIDEMDRIVVPITGTEIKYSPGPIGSPPGRGGGGGGGERVRTNRTATGPSAENRMIRAALGDNTMNPDELAGAAAGLGG